MELRFVGHDSQDYRMLAAQLDEYYFQLVGDVHLRYAQANQPKNFACIIVAYDGQTPVGCGCWKRVDGTTAEVKRIYVVPSHRRQGIASSIIRALEADIAEKQYPRIILETARTTADSEALYLSLGYRYADFYGSPAGAENCLCFEKNVFH